MKHRETRKSDNGKVWLVGAGPGDPGLITAKGLKLISAADCIIYDYLVPEDLLRNPGGAELIYVGKSGALHTMEQREINALLVSKAREGLKVVRLKGGDPFIFGRGGEEALELAEAGIEFEVVPGVSSASAVPAYAGIPVTHRGMASAVTFITGHEDPAKEGSDIDWESLAALPGTLVFLMGVKNLPSIVENLVRAGRSADEEIAVIRWGTTAGQMTVAGRLGDIVEKAEKADLKPPAVIVAGKVVSLRERLGWFERKPLFGRTIIVTRTREQAGALSERLIDAGAHVMEIPTIKTLAPESFDSLDRSMEKMGDSFYDWVVFTSRNGVQSFFSRAFELSRDARLFRDARIAAIGPSTAEALKERGLVADLVPAEYRAEGLAEELRDVRGKNILIARAAEARDTLPDSLRQGGNTVDIAEAYRTVHPPESREALKRALSEGVVDMVTFTSSSTVKNFALLLDDRAMAENLRFASIGPVTSVTARELGFEMSIEAREYTIKALAEAIIDYYSERSGERRADDLPGGD